MTLLKRIRLKPSELVFALFILTHIFLFGINKAEWGDTYRILRASEYIREFSYPVDEKRPPLFSAVLALRPSSVDPILWGHVFMFAISLISFFVFKEIVFKIFKKPIWRNLALILFLFNPIYLYWSLRIYADTFFALFVLLSIFVLYFSSLKPKIKFLLTGMLTGLSVLIRFEGYLLAFSLGLGVLFWQGISLKEAFKNLVNPVLYSLGVLLFVIPLWLWRSPFDSSYLAEPSGRAYDFRMVLTFIAAYLVLFGFSSGFVFLAKGFAKFKISSQKYLGIVVFVFVETLLILLWPAAIPRLFVPLVPILIIPLVAGMKLYFDNDNAKTLELTLVQLFLLAFYAASQYFLKLQFSIVIKPLFVLSLAFQLGIIYFSWKKMLKPFYLLLSLSAILWSFSTILLHRDIYFAVKSAGDYAQENLDGLVIHNDPNSVVDWYLNYKEENDGVRGVYLKLTQPDQVDKSIPCDVDYVIFTNEHNPDLDTEIESPYFDEIAVYSYSIGDTIFFARIYKFIGNNL